MEWNPGQRGHSLQGCRQPLFNKALAGPLYRGGPDVERRCSGPIRYSSLGLEQDRGARVSFRAAILFSCKVPLSRLGRWCDVHKAMIWRGVLGPPLAWWPLLSRWMGERGSASMVYVEEKWRKLRGRWRYGFVVLHNLLG